MSGKAFCLVYTPRKSYQNQCVNEIKTYLNIGDLLIFLRKFMRNLK